MLVLTAEVNEVFADRLKVRERRERSVDVDSVFSDARYRAANEQSVVFDAESRVGESGLEPRQFLCRKHTFNDRLIVSGADQVGRRARTED